MKTFLTFIVLLSGVYSLSAQENYLQKANDYYKSGDYQNAIQNYNLYKSYFPQGEKVDELIKKATDCQQIMGVAKILFDKEDYENAAIEYNRLLQLNEDDSFSKRMFELCLKMIGKKTPATENKNTEPETENKNAAVKSYNPDGIEMMYVEGPSGNMTNFFIGKYPITQGQWMAVMGKNPSQYKGTNRPVESVSWNDIQEFLKKLNARTGRNYRLPTEIEWLYAAKGGKNRDNYKYAGSDNANEVAWFSVKRGSREVGTKLPNSLGIYDMSGNVWEWCQDCADNKKACTKRILRGGSWANGAGSSSLTIGNVSYSVKERDERFGFRIALSE